MAPEATPQPERWPPIRGSSHSAPPHLDWRHQHREPRPSQVAASCSVRSSGRSIGHPHRPRLVSRGSSHSAPPHSDWPCHRQAKTWTRPPAPEATPQSIVRWLPIRGSSHSAPRHSGWRRQRKEPPPPQGAAQGGRPYQLPAPCPPQTLSCRDSCRSPHLQAGDGWQLSSCHRQSRSQCSLWP